MKKLTLALAIAASPAFAEPVCEMRGAEPIEALELAKQKFLDGDFKGFADYSTKSMGSRAAASLAKPVQQLAGLFPKGFESCQTVAQRKEAGGMVQEVITFNIKGQDFPMSLYLLAAPTRGEMKISYLNFNTTLSDVLKSLY